MLLELSNVFVILFILFQIMDHIGAEITNENLCNSKNQNNPELKSFIKERWLDARKEVNLPAIETLNSVQKNNYGLFFNFSTGVLFWNINRTIISYARIYKCNKKIFLFEKLLTINIRCK
jgi:hypothetical protein